MATLAVTDVIRLGRYLLIPPENIEKPKVF